MKKIALFLFSVEYLDHGNGVDRHVHIFMDSLKHYRNITCIYFAFVSDPSLFSLLEIKINSNCEKIFIPLPDNPFKIFNNPHALLSFNRETRDILRKYLVGKKNRILHVHTLNLMPLALLIRNKYKCKVISHIHSIAWKYNIDCNFQKFFHLLNSTNDKKQKLYVLGEYEAYNYADNIICVTKVGKEFVKQMQEVNTPPIYVIPNGLPDTFQHIKDGGGKVYNEPFKIVFVGGTAKTKGVTFLLDAVYNLPLDVRNNIIIIVAGKTTYNEKTLITKKYYGLNIVFTNWLKHEILEEIYNQADLGAIMSLHEQCSYAAIEMMMHQIPIISSDADGLGEIFHDGDNAMVVPIRYDFEEKEVRIDKQILSKKLTLLIQDSDLRKRIGVKGRIAYIKNYTAKKMTESLILLYYKIIDNEA